ncbi:hypothetical protein EDC01DRAFT_711548 [Geopyxis carbonaria]|nr:hypothetical protein EDC01DRAFT_711548 [Geopyxis carbonaria]
MAALIQQIDSRSVHQIQSGQVINDGLTSAVKELVENSIDAGATSIEVRFKNYGLECIDVIDNGNGVSAENYESIALKHYTSKLREYSDLESVSTFGFRGEALSSLCALSVLQITTATAEDAPKGVRLEFEVSGKLKSKTVVAASKGTTVSVGTLFKTLPVRRRELERNIKREYAKVLGILQAYASISTGVKFSIFNQPAKGKRTPAFATKGNPTTRENISNVFGSKTLTALVPLDLQFEMKPAPKSILNKNIERDDEQENREVKIVGHISRPVVGEGRNAPDRQMFFVNGRPCVLPQIAKAFNEVYKGFNVTQSPFIFADLRLDTHAYDVNVSPDKRTILLHDQVELLENLKKTSLAELFTKHEQTVPVNQLGSSNKLSHKQLRLAESFSSPLKETSSPIPSSPLPSRRRESTSDINSEPTVFDIASSPPPQSSFQEREESVDEQGNGEGEGEGESLLSKFSQKGPISRNAPPKYNLTSASAARLPFNPPSMLPNPPEPRFSTTTTADILDLGSEGDFPSSQGTESPVKLPTSYRSPRKTNAPATITIGDRNPVLSGTLPVSPPLPPNKRRKVDIGKTRVSGMAKSAGFVSALHKFRAPGTQQSAVDDEEDEDEEEDDRAVEEDNQQDSDTEMDMGANDDATNTDRQENIDTEEVTPVLDSTPLFLPVPHLDDSEEEPVQDSEEIATSEAPAITLDDDQDEDYVPESQLGKQAKLRAERLLKDAEQKEAELSAPIGDQLFERAGRILRGSQKRTTKPWIRTSTTSLAELELLSQRFSKASLAAQPAHSPASSDVLTLNDAVAEERLTLTVTKADFMAMQIKGQFNKGFILATRGAEVFIIDQHASDEKYNFETLQATTVVQHQPLVIPLELQLMAMDEVTVIEHLDLLKRNGFVVAVDPDAPTGRRCRLTSLPMSKETTFGIKDLEELIHLLHQADGAGSHSALRCSKVRAMFAMRACRRSVMVGTALPLKAMERIVRHMGTLDKPWNCPHGRPTMRHLADLRSVDVWSEFATERGGGAWLWEGEGWRGLMEGEEEEEAAAEGEGEPAEEGAEEVGV